MSFRRGSSRKCHDDDAHARNRRGRDRLRRPWPAAHRRRTPTAVHDRAADGRQRLSAGYSPTRSPPSSATSPASTRRASSPATPASARASTSRASPIDAARSPNRGRSTCGGRSSRPPSMPAPTPPTASATNGRRRGSANSAAPRSRKSTSPADSPRRSGTCSPATKPSLRQAPPTPWPPDGP
jgi:hypothetical protein